MNQRRKEGEYSILGVFMVLDELRQLQLGMKDDTVNLIGVQMELGDV